jgi:hypothetical protein
MAKKKRGDLPLGEELLDRSVGLLEGPLNRVVERVLKSRVVLLPVGLSLKVTLKAARLLVPPPPWTPSSTSSSASTGTTTNRKERR